MTKQAVTFKDELLRSSTSFDGETSLFVLGQIGGQK